MTTTHDSGLPTQEEMKNHFSISVNSVFSVRDFFSLRGVTLIEILMAVCILSFGMVPIFLMMTSTRQMTRASIQELQAISLVSSMIEGLNRIPGKEFVQLVPAFALPTADDSFSKLVPASFSLHNLGVPDCPPGFKRTVSLEMKHLPNLPAQRFSEPWGKIVEIRVEVRNSPKDPSTSVSQEKSLFKVSSCRVLGDLE